jgi:hypothetical protein
LSYLEASAKGIHCLRPHAYLRLFRATIWVAYSGYASLAEASKKTTKHPFLVGESGFAHNKAFDGVSLHDRLQFVDDTAGQVLLHRIRQSFVVTAREL